MASMWKHFKDGGWGMYLILFWSIITIGIVIERALYLFGSSINKDVFLATMQKCILAGDVAKAVKMCSAANAPLARIVQAGLVKVNRPDEEVQAAMDEAALREIPRIAKRTGFLALMANLSMLSGVWSHHQLRRRLRRERRPEPEGAHPRRRNLGGHELHGFRAHRRADRARRLRHLERQDPDAGRRHQRGERPGAQPRRDEPTEGQHVGRPRRGLRFVWFCF